MHGAKPILFLVVEFPPVNTTGNFRSLKFVKYLSMHGVNPVVVTLKPEHTAAMFRAPINNELLMEIPDGTPVYRLDCNLELFKPRGRFRAFLSHYSSFVDRIGEHWEPFLLDALGPIIKKHNPVAIYTSLPPFSMGPLAARVSKLYKLPLVLDMRDLWAYWGSDPHQSYFHFIVKKYIERNAFQSAAKIIGVTPKLTDIFSAAHPRVDKSKFVTIPNGFDSEVAIDTFETSERAKFVIGYTGSFYYSPTSHISSNTPWWQRKGTTMLHYSPVKEDWLYRTPYFFLRALAEVFSKYPGLRERIEFHFVGKETAWLGQMVDRFGLGSNYVAHGLKNRNETRAIQQGFDAFLCTSEKVLGGDHYCLPSKLFDYIDAGKPLLGFLTPGIQKQFITRSGLGICCDPDNVAEGVEALEAIIRKRTFIVNTAYLEGFKRINLARQLADVFKEVGRQPS